MKENEMKQIKILLVILVIVIGFTIFVEIKNSRGNTNQNNNITENKVDMTNVTIDGYTKDSLEKAKPYLNDSTYNKYSETFNKIEDGDLEYEENMSLQTEEQEITNEDTENSRKVLENALNSNNWHYYVDSKGHTTNTIIFDNIDTH